MQVLLFRTGYVRCCKKHASSIGLRSKRAEEHRPEFHGLRERGEVSPGSEVCGGKGRPLEKHFLLTLRLCCDLSPNPWYSPPGTWCSPSLLSHFLNSHFFLQHSFHFTVSSSPLFFLVLCSCISLVLLFPHSIIVLIHSILFVPSFP